MLGRNIGSMWRQHTTSAAVVQQIRIPSPLVMVRAAPAVERHGFAPDHEPYEQDMPHRWLLHDEAAGQSVLPNRALRPHHGKIVFLWWLQTKISVTFIELKNVLIFHVVLVLMLACHMVITPVFVQSIFSIARFLDFLAV